MVKNKELGNEQMAAFSINLMGRVRNFNLPKKKPLLPLMEAIVNSIYAIEDRMQEEIFEGQIHIQIVRESQERLHVEGITNNVNDITGFIITDNGIGFNKENMNSFMQSDSTYRITKGGKGIGRFSWLKTFQSAEINSIFIQDGEWKTRQFTFSLDKPDIDDALYDTDQAKDNLTRIELKNYKPEYQKNVPRDGEKIAVAIMHHCFIYLMSPECPQIYIKDEDTEYCINTMFENMIDRDKNEEDFQVMDESFHILHCFIKDSMLDGNRLFYFANDRKVQEIDLDKMITNLSKKIYTDKGYYYIGIVSGDYLDENVNDNRDSFAIPYEGDKDEISIKNITEEAVFAVEERLEDYLSTVQANKERYIKAYIKNEAPQYSHLIQYMPNEIAAISPGLTERKLDDELYKIKRKFENQVKEENKEIINALQVGVINYEQYQKKLQTQFAKISEANRASLSEYVAHRKVVLELLRLGLQSENFGKYNKEEYLHNLIYPMRKTSEDIEYQSHNLWLIDEKLAYADYIASDIPFDNDPKKNRPDIMMLDHPVAVSDEPNTGRVYETITIFELKRPMRNDYTTAENPMTQMLNYVSDLRTNKIKDKNGRPILTSENTQFYLYAVCDLTPKLRELAFDQDMIDTPDKRGMYRYHKNRNAHIEILSYDKILSDAQKRNKIFFDKLGIS